MYMQILEYCLNIAENVCIFLHNFLLSYKSYVLINITIIIINILLIRTVKQYTSKNMVKHNESVGRKPQINYQNYLMYLNKLPNLVRQKQKASFENNKNNKSTTITPNPDIKNTGRTNLACPNFVTQAAEGLSIANCKKQTNFDETLDEITWGCDDSPLSLLNVENVKFYDDFCDDLTKTQSKDIVNEELSHPCEQNEKDIDIGEENGDNVLNQEKEENGSQENLFQKENMKQEVQERGKKMDKSLSKIFLSGKSDIVKMKSGKIKQKQKKCSQHVTSVQMNPGRQNDALDTTKIGYSDMQFSPLKLATFLENREMPASIPLKTKRVKKKQLNSPKKIEIKPGRQNDALDTTKIGYSDMQFDISPLKLAMIFENGKIPANIHTTKRLRKKQLLSPRKIEHFPSAKTSDICSRNSDEQCDPELGGSEQQFQGNHSESSLVCKRDSWIWFSPEMRPSVEDFTARQRKFQSRDPRVAELAVEISRQEEMNRDIERAAESLIDSSSPSTCKLQEASLRVVCSTDAHRKSCGAIKNRVVRKSRMTPYTLPDKRLVVISPTLMTEMVTEMANGDHNRDELIEQFSAQKISPVFKLTKLEKISPEQHVRKVQDTFSPSPKRRKLCQKNLSQTTKSTYLPEPRAASSVSSDHIKRSAHHQSPFVEISLPHSVFGYNSPAAKVIRQPLTSCRYSPLYDNSTMISSTQCSMCSLDSNSQEPTKAMHSQEKYRSLSAEWTNERSQLNVSAQKQNINSGINTQIDLIHSPSECDIHKGRSVKPQMRLTSPNGRRHAKQSLGILADVTESNPESSYRQCLISKEVNTAVQRLLFDNEKSSSSHSPSSRSKNILVEVNTDEECNSVDYSKKRIITNAPHFPGKKIDHSNFTKTSPPNVCTDMHRDKQQLQSDKVSSDDHHCGDVSSQPTSLNISRTDSRSSLKKSSHKSTNIYTPDYYLGKRIALKKQQGSKGNATYMRWKKADVKWAKTVSLRLYSPWHVYSKSAVHKLETNRPLRETIKCKPCLKLTSCHGLKPQISSTHLCEAVHSCCPNLKPQNSSTQVCEAVHTCFPNLKSQNSSTQVCEAVHTCFPNLKPQNSSTQVCEAVHSCSPMPTNTPPNNRLPSGESEEGATNLSQIKSTELNASNTDPELGKQRSKMIKVASDERLEAFSHHETYAKKPNVRKSFPRTNSPTRHEGKMCPALSPNRTSHIPKKSAAASSHCKNEGVQLESTKLLVTGSTNNSASNLSCGSDKPECSANKNLSTQTAQFYFVTQAELNHEQTSSENNKFRYLGLANNTQIDMFEKSQIAVNPLQSSTHMKPYFSMINSDFKRENSSEFQKTLSKKLVMNPLNLQYITNTSPGSVKKLHVKSLPTLNAQVGGEHLEYNQQYKCVQVKVDDPKIPFNVICHSRPKMSFPSNKKHDVFTFLPQSSSGEEDKSQNDGCQVKEDNCICKTEKSRLAISSTFESGQCNSSTPATTSAIKNNSNPDSGYDESFSERVIDTVPIDSVVSGFECAQLQLDNEQEEQKCGSVSPCSDSSDFAHRSRISSEWDSEQDTLPSSSDDAFQSSNNQDLLFSVSPNRSYKTVQSAFSYALSRDLARHEICEDLPVEKYSACGVTNVSPYQQEKTCKKNDINLERKSHLKNGIEILGDVENKYLPLSGNVKCTSIGTMTSSITTEMATCSPALDPTLTLPLSKAHMEMFQGITQVPKKTAGRFCHNWEPKNARNIINDSETVHASGMSCHQMSSVEEEASKALYTFPKCDDNIFPLCPDVHFFTATSQKAELPISLPNPACKSNLLDSHMNQSREDFQNYQARVSSNECLGSLIASELCSPQVSKEICPALRRNTSLTENLPSNSCSVDDEIATEIHEFPIAEETKLSLPENNTSDTPIFQLKKTSQLTKGWHSYIPLDASENIEDNLPQCTMLPPTSSDEEDCELETHLEKVNMCEHDTEVNKITSCRTGKDLSQVSECENYKQQTRNKIENVHSTPLRKVHFSTSTEYLGAKSVLQRKSKIFLSSRSMAFSDILKRF